MSGCSRRSWSRIGTSMVGVGSVVLIGSSQMVIVPLDRPRFLQHFESNSDAHETNRGFGLKRLKRRHFLSWHGDPPARSLRRKDHLTGFLAACPPEVAADQPCRTTCEKVTSYFDPVLRWRMTALSSNQWSSLQLVSTASVPFEKRCELLNILGRSNGWSAAFRFGSKGYFWPGF
jgi:hypothetical protein